MNNNQVALVEAKKAVMGDGLRRELELALPRQVSAARFQRVLLTSITHDQRLLAVDPAKVIMAALKVAPLGLMTDPMLGEAYLIADGRGDVQVRVGYRGLLKLARQSGEVASIYAHEVFAKDEFMVALGDKKSLIHKPEMFGDRGDVVGYYAVVKYLNSETDFEIMATQDINKIRSKSDGYKAFKGGKIKDTPWESAYDEMAKKTVLRRLMKRVPASADLQDALRHEAEADHREYGGGDGMRDITPERAERSQPERAPEYVSLFDADGAEILLQPGEVNGWVKDQVKAATADELAALREANADLDSMTAAIDAELDRRNGVDPEPAKPDPAQDTPPPAEHAAESSREPDGLQATRAAGDAQARAWTTADAEKRGKEIATVLRDHGDSAANLSYSWEQHKEEIMSMPGPAQRGLRKVYETEMATIENAISEASGEGRDEDERQPELLP